MCGHLLNDEHEVLGELLFELGLAMEVDLGRHILLFRLVVASLGLAIITVCMLNLFVKGKEKRA